MFPYIAIEYKLMCMISFFLMKGQVEVNQIGAREFLLKVSGSHKPGGFTQLMEAMNSLGLEVVNTNFTTFGGEILSIFIARVNVISQ